MKTITIQKIDEVFSKIEAPKDVFNPLYEFFAVHVKQYWFIPSVRLGTWDGKIRFIQKSGKVLTGLIPLIKKFARGEQIEIIDRSGETYPNISTSSYLESIKRGINIKEFKPFRHQNKAVILGLRKKRGIIQIGTGGGKTLVAALIINYLRRIEGYERFLYIVPRIQLVEQTSEKFVQYGLGAENVGKFYGGIKDISSPITVATWQSLESQKKHIGDFLRDIQFIGIDECFGLRATVLRKVAEKTINADYRLGFTATLPDLEEKADYFLILGVTGPVIMKELERELIKKDLLSPIQVKLISVTHPDYNGKDFQEERKYLESNTSRNNLIVDLAELHKRKNENILILVEKIENHGLPLQKLLEERIGEKIPFIRGSMDVKEREVIRKYLEEGGGNIVLATYGTTSYGIDVLRLHVIILGMAGKSKIRHLQSIGRGLRKHKTKPKLTIYDIADDTPYSTKHTDERIRHCVKRGYPIEIIDEKDVIFKK